MSKFGGEHGALVVDKPAGRTSSFVVQAIKRNFDLKRVGHAGTLDPMATGVLVVLVGKATKLQELFLDSNKSYEGEFRLGLCTTTDDIEGEVEVEDSTWVLEREPEEVCRELERVFSGEIEQVPPKVSAVHVQGVRSYKRARRGEEFRLEPRRVFVERLVLGFRDSRTISYQVRCSKGTYVRSLARDLGNYLGTYACLSRIRRTESGGFTVGKAVAMERLFAEGLSSHLIPLEHLLVSYPTVEVSDLVMSQLRLGDQSGLRELRLPKGDKFCRLTLAEGLFGGLLQCEESEWKLRFLL